MPLASLRLALARRLGAPSRVQKAFSGVPGAVLAHVASGALVPERVLAEALAELVRGLEGGRPWVVLNPMSLVDGATLGALLSARALGADFVLFGRFPMDLPLPRPLVELGEEVRELTLPPLKTADARVVAEAILGRGTSDEVARRVAVLGGDTVLGVMEAARTLIATGELVQGREGFEWRVAPRHGAHAIGTEELLGERLELLDGDARRVLEAACVVPDGWPADRLGEVAALDGIGEHAYARSLETLSREALVADREHPRPASSLLRWHLLGRIPPGRFTELHRFVADVVRAAGPSSPPLRAELGYYMQEGGLEEEARPHVVSAVEALVEAGYERAARQLSSWLARQGEERDEPLDRSEAFEEGPPSSEHFLGDLLDEASAEDEARAAPARAIPPPRRAEATLPGATVELARDEEDEDDAVTRERPLEPPSELVPAGEGAMDAELDALLAAPLEAAVDAELDAMLDEEDAIPSERTSISPAPLKPFVQDAVRAVRERDFAALEQAIRRALAEGATSARWRACARWRSSRAATSRPRAGACASRARAARPIRPRRRATTSRRRCSSSPTVIPSWASAPRWPRWPSPAAWAIRAGRRPPCTCSRPATARSVATSRPRGSRTARAELIAHPEASASRDRGTACADLRPRALHPGGALTGLLARRRRRRRRALVRSVHWVRAWPRAARCTCSLSQGRSSSCRLARTRRGRAPSRRRRRPSLRSSGTLPARTRLTRRRSLGPRPRRSGRARARRPTSTRRPIRRPKGWKRAPGSRSAWSPAPATGATRGSCPRPPPPARPRGARAAVLRARVPARHPRRVRRGAARRADRARGGADDLRERRGLDLRLHLLRRLRLRGDHQRVRGRSARRRRRHPPRVRVARSGGELLGRARRGLRGRGARRGAERDRDRRRRRADVGGHHGRSAHRDPRAAPRHAGLRRDDLDAPRRRALLAPVLDVSPEGASLGLMGGL
ncbi:MAG: hypothetical protein M5U28_10685 [Sandaracinaceae bacterium]|nr:hypothetical protein [Sandaracinaceae bacterium]